MSKLKKNKGITMVALIVTIVILLILAGITIGVLTGENGLINKAGEAKEQAKIANEKEEIEQAVTGAMKKDRYGNISKENLDKELNEKIGNNTYNSNEIEEGITVTFTESNRSYLVDIDGNVIEYIIREPEPEPEKSTTVATLQKMSYGVIEIEFLNEKGYEIGTPNEPILKDGMKAVYWAKDESGELDLENPENNTYEITSDNTNFKEENWYEYIAQIAGNDGKTSRWANAMTVDGSYYVWIPRYSYRIIYFKSQANENAYRAGTLSEEEALEKGYILGYSDARGIVDKDGKRPTSVTSTTSISVNDKYFRTHPVFDGNEEEGGWDSKLTGIWVMKYEASKPGASATESGSGTMPKSVPNVKAWGNTNVSIIFNYAKDLYTTLNSHMMKNSEWGAAAYLTESKYGRNGTEVSANQCSEMITGAGRGLNNSEDEEKTGTSSICNSIYEWNEISDIQKYNGTVGQLSSSTGNVYGIYDMAGGSYEFVMGSYQDEDGNILIGENSGLDESFYDKTDKKYYQLYQKNDTNGEDLGEALYETYQWNSDSYFFLNNGGTMFVRGGYYGYGGYAGVFSFSRFPGNAYYANSFRVCLAVKK